MARSYQYDLDFSGAGRLLAVIENAHLNGRQGPAPRSGWGSHFLRVHKHSANGLIWSRH